MAKVSCKHIKDTKNCSVFEPPAGAIIRSPLYLDKSKFGGKSAVSVEVTAS